MIARLEVSKLRAKGEQALQGNPACRKQLWLTVVEDRALRACFDAALDRLHYAKSCQRVGRCMRLAVMSGSSWVGGIVLGSTFPNVDARDRALGLKIFVNGFHERGLTNAWCADNKEYWSALQSVVNHARTFVFPEFQGRGLGKKAHRLLLTAGMDLWRRRYGPVYALDTLCDSGDSGLFISNRWKLVGETKGYTADYKRSFTASSHHSINNAALKRGKVRWQVWVRVIDKRLRPTTVIPSRKGSPSTK